MSHNNATTTVCNCLYEEHKKPFNGMDLSWSWHTLQFTFITQFYLNIFFSPFHSRLELVHTSLGVCACAVKHDLPVCTLPTTIVRIKIANMEHGIVFFANFGYLNGFHILPHSTLHLNTSTFNPKKIRRDNPKATKTVDWFEWYDSNVVFSNDLFNTSPRYTGSQKCSINYGWVIGAVFLIWLASNNELVSLYLD